MKNERFTFNVLTAINESWLLPARTLIASIKHSCKNDIINIYLLYSELSTIAKKSLMADENKFCNIKLIKINDEDIKNAPHIERISKETYYRLFASEVLPQEMNKIMWIDADAIVVKPLQKFYQQNLTGVYYAAYKEVSNLSGKRNLRLRNLHLADDFPYVNAGVLLINLDEIRKVDTWRKDIKNYIMTTNSDLLYADQDIINVLFNTKGKVKILEPPCIFNQRASKQYFRKPYSILHFAGKAKPWLTKGQKGFLIWYKYAFSIKGQKMTVFKTLMKALFAQKK